MKLAFTILFWLWFVVSSVVYFAIALVIVAVTAPFDRNRRWLHQYACFWGHSYVWVHPLWRCRIEGREKLPWHGAAVLVSNHDSMGDIVVLYGLFRPFKWVSKASVFKVPIVGWLMKLNQYVAIERGKKDSIAKMMAACRDWLARGVPVLLFPEGTRSKDGTMLPFKDGAFRLAIEANCPVIPIVLTGTAETLPKHGFVFRDRAYIVARVLDPIDPAVAGGDVERLRESVRDVMVAAKAKLVEDVAAERARRGR